MKDKIQLEVHTLKELTRLTLKYYQLKEDMMTYIKLLKKSTTFMPA